MKSRIEVISIFAIVFIVVILLSFIVLANPNLKKIKDRISDNIKNIQISNLQVSEGLKEKKVNENNAENILRLSKKKSNNNGGGNNKNNRNSNSKITGEILLEENPPAEPVEPLQLPTEPPAEPSFENCNDGQGILVNLNPIISGCEVNCSTCGTAGPVGYEYNECDTSTWNCGGLDTGEETCVGPSEEKYLDLPSGSTSRFITPVTKIIPVAPVTNTGYAYNYQVSGAWGGVCTNAAYYSAWNDNFRNCYKIINNGSQAILAFAGYFLGDRCSGENEVVSLSSSEFNLGASRNSFCGGYGQSDYTFDCSPPGIPVTEPGCQIDGEVCAKGEASGYCDNGECKQLNFSIEQVQPIQVLEGFDWIQNKEGMVRVKVRMSNPLAPDDIFTEEPPIFANLPAIPVHIIYSENVNVKLTLWKMDESFPPLPDPIWIKQWNRTQAGDIPRSYTVQELKQGGDSVNFFDVAIPELGIYKFEAQVDYNNNHLEINEGDNNKNSSEFFVLKTIAGRNGNEFGKLKLIFFPIKIGRFRSNFNSHDFEMIVNQQYQFLKDVYPIDPDKIEMEINYKLGDAITPSTNLPALPVLTDAYIGTLYAQLCNEAAIYHSDSSGEIDDVKLIAIIPDEYASFFGGFSGLRIISCNAAIVKYSAIESITSHEVAHMYGLRVPGTNEEYKINPKWGNVLQVDGWRESEGVLGAKINFDKNLDRNDVEGDEQDIYTYIDENGEEQSILIPFGRWFCMMGRGGEYLYTFWIDSEDYGDLKIKLTE